ncbi:MAG: hypothetical protein WB987_02430 [Candidatus Acidiferrales bacterium]
MTFAIADFDVSAALVAVTITVEGDGGAAGAMYSALSGPLDATVPSVELPPATPFTVQLIAVEGLPVPVTLTVNACPAPVDIVAEVGEIPTAMSSCSVTTADAVASELALLDAVTVTLAGAGKTLGAVYKPPEEIVPTIAFPPTTPPAYQVTFVFEAPVTVA